MRTRIILLSVSTTLVLASVPVLLAAKGGPAGKAGTHAPKPHAVAAVKTSHTAGTSTPKTTHAAKVKAAATGHEHTPTAAGKSAKTGGSKKTTSTASAARTSSTLSPTWRPTNPVAQKLSTKPTLLARAKTTLPPGTDLNLATAGFKNFGQFVAAMNVSNNLHIDFGQLKAAMTGTTLAGTPTATGSTASLGQAIHRLRPTVDADDEAARATARAETEIR